MSTMDGRVSRSVSPVSVFGPIAALAATVFCISQLSFVESGTLNGKTAGIAAGTWAFAVAGGLGLFASLWHWRQEAASLAKTRCLLASLAVVGLSAWFWQVHWLGLALWLW